MAHTIYNNFVLENKIEDMLSTSIDVSNYMTIDYSLTEEAGNIKKIHTYTATGDVEDLAMGNGNTGDIEVSFEEKTYTVGTTQGRFPYYDEQESADPMVVETGLKGLTDKMANDLTSKCFAEFGKATLTHAVTSWNFDTIVDAIAKYPYENEDGLFIVISPKIKAAFRKALGDELKYVEGFVRTGYIGSVCGVPVIVSKAVPDKTAYLGTKEAVTCFIKKGVEVEQERDANVRKNTVFARKVAVVALTDATRVIKLVQAG